MVESSLEEFDREYPFTSHFLELNGNRLHYLDEGPRNGPVLLMVHGNPTWSFYFRKLISAFSNEFRVIVPDHIGCGYSDKPQNYAYTLANHIQNLTHLVISLELRNICLVVHDWGGAIGFGFAGAHPELVKKFVVFNTAAFFVPKAPLRIQMCRVPVLGKWLVRGLNGFCRAALWFATSQGSRFTKAVKRGYLAPYNNWANRVAIHSFVMDIPLEIGHPTRDTLNRVDAGLSQFQNHPMIIFWGADDFCFTRADFLPEWQTRFPAADIHLLENAGHYVVEDAHERIIPRMKGFLDKTQ